MPLPSVGVVVIGRNEGERLRRCILSLRSTCPRIVYVDSGSTDGSPDWARSQGLEVVELDMRLPFTAARARNLGFRRLVDHWHDTPFVQFVDGDCTVAENWISTAAGFLTAHSNVAVACGRRREMFPEVSVFNAQCDREWNTPVGEARYCGGDALVRRSAFEDAGGFRDTLIAGEEPELCIRLRAAGWKIWRLDHEMTLHDAAILHWRQWWRRSVRAGHAFAEGASLHGSKPERHWVKETWRAILWGLALPFIGISIAVLWHPLGLLLFFLYPFQLARLASRLGTRDRNAWIQAGLLVAGRFPEAEGAMRYWWKKMYGSRSRLIEYKAASP